MQDQPPASQPHAQQNQIQDHFRVQGQPFPGAQPAPNLAALPFQPQHQLQRPAGMQLTGQLPGQLPGQLLTRPPAAMLPSLSAQWTSTAQMYQALRQQNLLSAQGKAPTFNLPVSAAHHAGVRPMTASAKPSETANRKYKTQKKKAAETAAAAAATAPPKSTQPLTKERMPRSEQLTKLQDLDDRILRAASQKKAEAHCTLRSGEHIRKKLRLYAQSDSTSPGLPTSQAQSGEKGYWSFTLWGKVIEGLDAVPNFQPQQVASQRQNSKPLSHYIKHLRLTVFSKANMDGKPEEIIWTKGGHKGESRDRFCLRRQGVDPVQVKVEVELDSQPQLHALGVKMAYFMQSKMSTRTTVLQALSTYFKMHNLQDGSGQIKCDHVLRRVFEGDTINLKDLPNLMDEHLHRPEPYTFEYTIRPGNATEEETACYDLDLHVPFSPAEQQSIPALEKLSADPMLDHLQLQINGLVTAANERARRQELLLGFSNNPVEFINGMLASQARDLRAPKQGSIPTALRRTQFFDGRWVDDAALRYLHRKLAAGA